MSLTVEVQDPQAGPMFYMAERDWSRFGSYLKDLGNAVPPVHDRYILFAGTAGGGLIGLLGWAAVLVTLPGAPTLAFYVIGLALLALTVAAAGIAWSNRSTESFLAKKLRKDSDLLWDDMNRTHRFGSDAG